MGKYDGILLCTDLDRTLTSSDGTVSGENVNAINYFMANGGYFTFASGRSPAYLSRFRNLVIPNVPIVGLNGAVLYDAEKAEFIRTVFLDKKADIVFDFFFDNHINDFNYSTFYCLNEQFEFSTDNNSDLDGYKKHFKSAIKNKFIFSFKEADKAHEVQQYLSSLKEYEDYFEFSRSWNTGLEILPITGNKGSGVKALADYLGNVYKIVCAGDFENDVSMLKIADIGYAVSNACQCVKNVAKRITVSNDESAIAAVISEL